MGEVRLIRSNKIDFISFSGFEGIQGLYIDMHIIERYDNKAVCGKDYIVVSFINGFRLSSSHNKITSRFSPILGAYFPSR